MVAFDAGVLIDLFNPALANERKQRIDLLIERLGQTKTKVIVPAPAFAEFLVKADSAKANYFARIEKSSAFKVEPLSKHAAIECADLLGAAWALKDKRNVTKTKFKFDWMIVAIAKTAGAQCVYTCDDDVYRYSRGCGLSAELIDALPLPPQPSLPWGDTPGIHA